MIHSRKRKSSVLDKPKDGGALSDEELQLPPLTAYKTTSRTTIFSPVNTILSPGAKSLFKQLNLVSTRTPDSVVANCLGIPLTSSPNFLHPPLPLKPVTDADFVDLTTSFSESEPSTFISEVLSSLFNNDDVSIRKYITYLQNYFSSLGISHLFPVQSKSLFFKGRFGTAQKGSSLILDAPTSAGKSLVAYLLIVNRFLTQSRDHGNRILFLVPLISLAQQHYHSLSFILQPLGIKVICLHRNSATKGRFIKKSSNIVVICTYELGHSLVNSWITEDNCNSLSMIIIDEMHMLFSNRGVLLELILSKINFLQRSLKISPQIFGMSATLCGRGSQISSWLRADLMSSDFRPVSINYDCIATSDVSSTISHHLELNHRVLIFVQSRKETSEWAKKVSKSLPNYEPIISDGLSTPLSLISALKEAGQGNSELFSIISKGVAFHHALLDEDQKILIEQSFKDGGLRLLISTSTLAQGVNLPADVVIVFFRPNSVDASHLQQCSGRCGRLGYSKQGFVYGATANVTSSIKKTFLDSIRDQSIVAESQLTSIPSLCQLLLDGLCTALATSISELSIFSKSTLAFRLVNKNIFTNNIVQAMNFLEVNKFVTIKDSSNQSNLIYEPSPLGFAAYKVGIGPVESLTLKYTLETIISRGLSLNSELSVLQLIVPDYWFFKRIPLSSFLFDHVIDYLSQLESTIDWSRLFNGINFRSLRRYVNTVEKWEFFGPTLFQDDVNFDRSSKVPEVILRIKSLEILKLFCSYFNSMICNWMISGMKSFGEILKFLNFDLLNELKNVDPNISDFSIFPGDLEEFSRNLNRRTKMMLQFTFDNDYLNAILKILYPKIQFGVPTHLLPLMKLEHCTSRIAKILYENSVKTVADVAIIPPKNLIGILKKAKILIDDVTKVSQLLIEDAKSLIKSPQESDLPDVDIELYAQSNTCHFYDKTNFSAFFEKWSSASTFSISFDCLSDSCHVAVAVTLPNEFGVFEFHCGLVKLLSSYTDPEEYSNSLLFLEKMMTSSAHKMIGINLFLSCSVDNMTNSCLFFDVLKSYSQKYFENSIENFYSNFPYDLVMISSVFKSSKITVQNSKISLDFLINKHRILSNYRQIMTFNQSDLVKRSCILLSLFNKMIGDVVEFNCRELVDTDCHLLSLFSLQVDSNLYLDNEKLNFTINFLNNIISEASNYFTNRTKKECVSVEISKFVMEISGHDGLTSLDHLIGFERKLIEVDDLSNVDVIRSIIALKSSTALLEYCNTLPKSNSKFSPLILSLNFTDHICGRIHTINPNLQATPKKRNFNFNGKNFEINCRDFILCESNNSLISLDFKQIELRLIAHLAMVDAENCTNEELFVVKKHNAFQFISCFLTGDDVFESIRSKWRQERAHFDVSRDTVKRLIYAIIYGMGMERLSLELGVDVTQAESIKNDFLKMFPAVDDVLSSTLEFANVHGFILSILSRKFECSAIEGANRLLNFRVQSSAAEIFKCSVISAFETVKILSQKFGSKIKILLPIHDELIIQCPTQFVKEIAIEISNVMANIGSKFRLNIPLVVSYKISENGRWSGLS
ncbi:hypothetical protein RCL1_004781 [Eukaryota sp. TZLM3-RCL]